MIEDSEILGPAGSGKDPADSGVVVRRASLADLWGLAWLRTLAGWNQDVPFWRLLLTFPGAEVWVLARGKEICAVSSIWTYGSELAWIGMVIVHPAYRRRGFGKRLLQLCLCRCERLGVATVGLDATPAGEGLYKSLGFVSGEAISRMILPADAGPRTELDYGETLHSGRASKHFEEEWRSLDAGVLGVDRSGLIEAVASGAISCERHLDRVGRWDGFGMLRRGARHRYLGPLVASCPEVGRDLVLRLLQHSAGRSVVWDVPQKNLSATSLSQELGFEFSRKLTRMWLPRELPRKHPEWAWAIVDPALG